MKAKNKSGGKTGWNETNRALTAIKLPGIQRISKNHKTIEMKKSFFSVILIILCGLHVLVNAQNQGYKNPIIPGFYPDPSVCRVGDDFYLVNSTFEYFPGVPVFHSKDLIHWEQIGHCLTRKLQLPLDNCYASGGIYAPTIRYNKGMFYMTTTNLCGGGNFYVTASDPAGEWSDPIYVKQGGIDPTIFFDGDKTYFLSTGNGITMSELDIKTGQLIGNSRSIWSGTGGRYPEGPHLYKKDGYYYLMIAEGGTEYGHKVTIARSRNIWGPYESNPANPILTHMNANAQHNSIQGLGHADLVQAADSTWWMVHLGFRHHNSHHVLGRETFLAPVRWDKNTWPVVNGNGTVDLKMNCPTLPQVALKQPLRRLDFSEKTLPLEWAYLRNPDMKNYQLLPDKSILRLTGNAETIDGQKNPTFIGRRQQHINFEARTAIKKIAIRNAGRGGITVYMNNTSHYDLYITKRSGKCYLELCCRLGQIDQVVKSIPVKAGQVQFKVEGNENEYRFFYSTDGEKYIPVGKLDTKYLSSETAGGFTGVFIALFAEGEQTRIDFDYFEYAEKGAM